MLPFATASLGADFLGLTFCTPYLGFSASLASDSSSDDAAFDFLADFLGFLLEELALLIDLRLAGVTTGASSSDSDGSSGVWTCCFAS
jgi:hypothetical protein